MKQKKIFKRNGTLVKSPNLEEDKQMKLTYASVRNAIPIANKKER